MGQECPDTFLALSVVPKHDLNSDSKTLAASLKVSDCIRLCAITADGLAELQDNTIMKQVFLAVPFLLKFLDECLSMEFFDAMLSDGEHNCHLREHFLVRKVLSLAEGEHVDTPGKNDR